MLRPGDNVDGWCGKCKMILAHTIEAMEGDKPARVHCNTCRAQHNYRRNAPATSAAAASSDKPRTTKPRASRHQTLLKGKDMTQAKRYSQTDSYAPGDVVDHPSFGVGVAIALRDTTKIEVLFTNGSKVLVHGR